MNAMIRPIRIAGRNHDSIATLAAYTRECVASDRPNLPKIPEAVLLHAHFNPGLSVKDFADALAIQKPYITRSLDLLTELGFVTRGVAADDKRMICVRLTPSGVAHVEAMGRVLRGAM